MVASILTPARRYFEPGRTKVNWLTAIASGTFVPTRAEINLGTDFSGHVKDASGWDLTSDLIETPDLATTYNSKIGGRTKSADSGFMCYQDFAGIDVRTIFTLGATGFVLWLDGGDVAGQKMDIYPATVIACAPTRPLNDAAMISVQFGITARPAQYVTVP